MPTERSLRRIEAPFTTSPPSYRRSPAHHPPISHRHPGGEVDGDEADEDKDPQFFTPSTSSSDTSSTSSSKRKSARPYSSSTTRSNSSSSITDEQQGVPRNVQKQLLQDIEGTGGGISAFFFNDTGVYALKHLCDGREDIYGLPSSNQRRQIQNKVSRWKSLSEDKYYQLLAEYGVQPAVDPPQLPRQQAAAPTTTRTSMTPMIRGGGAPKRGDDDVDYHGTWLVAMPFLQFSFSLTSAFFIISSNFAARIDIDIENPERNREVKIIPFVNVVQDGVLHNGFDIAIDAIDMRDYVQDMYKAELISANEILLKMPSASHAWLNEPRTANCPRTQEAYEVARNSILLSDDRKIKLLLLRFPGSITLSNQHYSPQSMNGEIECDFAMKDTSFTFDGKNLKSVVTTVFWKVSVVEEQQRIVKQSTNSGKKKGAAKLSKYLSGMTI